jgi:phosphatidylserine/phosphatidylglycerophosphate/cardiolipin synthase-like enzyme
VSAFLSAGVVDAAFLGNLEAALKRGVKVWIAFGMGGEEGRDAPKPSWQRAESALRELRKRYKKTFFLMDCGKTRHKTHEKILIRDGDFVVSGSFNWLSYSGERGRGYRMEDALRVTEPTLVEDYFRDITARFEED